MLTTAPKMLTQTMLMLLRKQIKAISAHSAVTPAGNEYIIAEILPENKLPSKILAIQTQKALDLPRVKRAISTKILEIPIFAPGMKMGGKRLSIQKANVENPAKIAVKVSSLDLLYISAPNSWWSRCICNR